MYIPKVRVVYSEERSERTIYDVEKFIEDNQQNHEDEFNLFFEVYEDDVVVVFANLYAFDNSRQEIDEGEPRCFQIETAVLVKDIEGMGYCGNLYYLGDNDGWGLAAELLNEKPLWDTDALYEAGVEDFYQADSNFPDKYSYNWKYSLEYQKR